MNSGYHVPFPAFKNRTRSSVLVNASFNVRGQRNVFMPEEALTTFLGKEIEVLAAGHCLLMREDRNLAPRVNCKDHFEGNWRRPASPFRANEIRQSMNSEEHVPVERLL